MNKSTKIIENGFVFTGDKQHRAGVLTLIIQNGRIIEIGKRADALKATYPNAEVIDTAGKIIVPGFVDAHHTGESFILRYLTSGQSMSRWNKNPIINRALDYIHKEATFQEFLTLYRLSYYAALKSGVTTLAEYGIDTPEHSFMASLEVMQQTNQRGFIGLHNGDQVEAARKLHDSSIRFAFVIADEENLTTYNLQSSIRSARELQWPIILHLGQTRLAFNIVKKNFNKSIAQLYAEYRAMDSPAHLLHLSCFEDGDFEIIAKSQAALVYSPSAILQKETEIPPFEELLKRKITLAMGSDWGAAKPLENIQSYCSILKTLGLPLEKAYGLLALHTKNGAWALGLDSEIGTIETGKKADLVFLNLSEFQMNSILADTNAERILEVVLQEAVSQQVSDVMINGEFYVREGHVLTYSEEDLAREGQAIFKKFLSLHVQKAMVLPPPASILQFSSQQKNDNKSSAEEIIVEEGFRIIRKERTESAPQVKDTRPPETAKEYSKKLRRYLGMTKYSSIYQKENQVKNLNLILIATLFMIVTGETALAQSYAGDGATIEPTMLIDKPTAGLLKRGSYSVSSNFFQNGGVLMGISVGVFEPFTFGISYGGTDIIGPNKIAMNPLPGVNAKLRLVSEGAVMPALAIGFDSQGKEPYLNADSLKRYTIKSPGAYVAASKNYEFLGNLSLHGGLNKSMETNDGDKDLDIFVGGEKSIGRDISIMVEFDFAANDNNNDALGKGHGYLNFGFRWTCAKGLVVGFNLKNITKNQDNVNVGNRTLQIDYIGNF